MEDPKCNPISDEVWTEHYTKLLRRHETNKDDVIGNTLKQAEKAKIFNPLSYSITEEEIATAVKKLKCGKASGPDGITSEIIKACCPVLLPYFRNLFNQILNAGTYPDAWGQGIVTSIHKKGSTLDPNNYRGITVSSCPGKVFGTILKKRLNKYCDENNIIDDRQSSHRKKSRTTDNLFILRTLIEKYCITKNEGLFVGFIDFKKAFDSIWHEALFLKLLEKGIGGPFYNIVKDMYTNSTSVVKNSTGELSDKIPVNRGVRQGDVLYSL